jgi:LuxR family maltose regulon positive regulatory protein
MTILRWIDGLPADLLGQSPDLLLVQAWVLSLSGEREAAALAIAALERCGPLDGGRLPDGFSSLEASLATLRAMFPWGDFGVGLEYGRRAAELEDSSSPWRFLVSLSLGLDLYVCGEFEQAGRWFEQAMALAAARNRLRAQVSALTYRSLIAGELDRADEQHQLADTAFQLAREHRLEEAEGEVFVALGASLAVRGQLEEARSALERGVDLLKPLGHPRALADALIRQARVLLAIGDRDAAAAIAEARATVDSCPDPGIFEEWLVGLERPPSRRNGELSQRELVVLRALTGPLSERDIGRELFLSHSTVHSHAQSIYRKLGVSSRADAIQEARKIGLL